jgi:general secretion pathway protein C
LKIDIKGIWEKLKDQISSRLQAKKSIVPRVNLKDSNAFSASDSGSVVAPVRKALVTKPPFEHLYPYALSALIGYIAADLTVLAYRDLMLPKSPPPMKQKLSRTLVPPARYQYNQVITRNIFNSDGVIPDPLTQDGEEGAAPTEDGPAVPSNLPLNLVGTIVHANPGKSVATIESKQGGGTILPYVPGDDIEGLASLERVDRKRAIFRNSRNNRLEYIEIKDDALIKFGIKSPNVQSGQVKQEGNRFSIKKTDVVKHMENLPDLLQQARAVPNIIPGSGGRVDGFRILDIQDDSLFKQLGLQRMDVIKEVNGEPVDSPAKAMELYQSLKDSNNITIGIERDGRMQNLDYSIVQ